jgi:hypothetical protein
MKTLWRRNLLIVCLALLTAAIFFAVVRQKSSVSPAPENPFTVDPLLSKITNTEEVAAIKAQMNERLTNHWRMRKRAEDMTEAEKAQFEKDFPGKIKPAITRWCGAYAGHLSFRPEDVTKDTLREIVHLRSDAQAYDFVFNGVDVGVVDDAGTVYVDSLSTRAASDLLRIPKNPPPPLESSVSRDEILRVLKADSGRDFPPDQIAIRPTGRGSAMNGGAYVYVGEGVNEAMAPLAKYAMVFGPDGNLVSYSTTGP